MSDIEEITLPFSEGKQNAVIGHILLNTDNFCVQAVDKIQPTWFRNGHNSKLYGYVQRFCRQTGKNGCSAQEIMDCVEMRSEDVSMRNKMRTAISLAYQAAEQFRLKGIKKELTEWMQAKLLQVALSESSQLWNRKDFEKSAIRVKQLVKDYYDSSFEDNNEVSFAEPEKFLAEMEESRKHCLTTGLSVLDEYIMTRHEGGALQAGASTVVLAPVNVGKSSFLITTAMHNVRQGKSVLYMTHEDRFEDVRIRMLQCYLRMNINDLLDAYKTPEGLAKIKEATGVISKQISYVPVNKPGMTIQDVLPTIDRAQEKKKINNDGKGFDLLINDYPGKLSIEGAVHRDTRRVLAEVYDGFVQLALQYRWHSMVAMQVNRTGSKINKGQKGVEERLLTMEDAAEAWGPMETATTVLTLNRGPKAIQKNRLTVLVAKSRTSDAGRAVTCGTDYGCTYTHGNDLGGWGYAGTQVLDDIADAIMDTQNKNKYEPVSPAVIYAAQSQT